MQFLESDLVFRIHCVHIAQSLASMKDPFWRYVTNVSQYAGGGGSRKWKCNFCGLEKTGSVTCIKDHLAHVPNKDIGPCGAVPADVRANLEFWRSQHMGFHDVEDTNASNPTQVGSSQANQGPKRSRVEVGAQSAHISSTSSGGPSVTRTPLPKVNVAPKGSLQMASMKANFQKQAIKEATREMTRLFIRCAIPFNVARTNQWKKTIRAISCIGCEWEGPSLETLHTRELKKEKTYIER